MFKNYSKLFYIFFFLIYNKENIGKERKIKMFNQRRKHSAYLEYDDGKIKSTEPNSPKEKAKEIINTHKKELNITWKDVLYLIITILIICLFFYFSPHFIQLISNEMNVETSNYEISNKITEKTSNINKTERENQKQIAKNNQVFINSINNYNTEISSVYSSLKGYISLYYNKKEGLYLTQKSLNTMIDRIDLDISIINKDSNLTEYESLQKNYITRLSNIKNYLESNIEDREIALDNLNELILEENDLYKTMTTEMQQILKEKEVDYLIVDNKFKMV